MKLSSASIESIIWRFYLMMFIVIGSLYIGYPNLASLSVPVFLSCLLGVKIKNEEKPTERNKEIFTEHKKLKVA